MVGGPLYPSGKAGVLTKFRLNNGSEALLSKIGIVRFDRNHNINKIKPLVSLRGVPP